MRALLIANALFMGLTLSACERARPAQPQTEASALQIGGPFHLIDTEGRPVSEKTLLGKPTAMFFGFTYCPEVCPTTLAAMTATMATMGPKADKMNVVFVSLDPERDTQAQMKLYLSDFDPRIRGFTGSLQQTDAMAKAFRVYHNKVPIQGGGYVLDHSPAIYLFDRRGAFVSPLRYGSSPEEISRQLRELISHR